MDEHERARLTSLASEGEADALQQLIVEYHPILRQKLIAKTHEAFRTLVDADDVLQQAYIAAFRSIGDCHFDGPGGLYKWLERIALNDLCDAERALERKKRDVRRQVALGDLSKGRAAALRESLVTLAGQLGSDDRTPSRIMARDEAVSAALSCMARLTDEQREVLRSRYFDNEPVPQLATRLGKSEQAVHALCYRAIKEMRRLMGSISQYISSV